MPLKARLKLLYHKLKNWEYWPFEVVYFPVFFYYGYLILRTRSFFFFTSSNPNIEFGGMFGERKSDIFELIPKEHLPKTVLVARGDVTAARNHARIIHFPLICKPDIGERGIWVKKINDCNELVAYANQCPADFLMQEFVDYEVELGVFYVKYPGKEGAVSSVVKKGFFTVTGNGIDSVETLLSKNTRSQLQIKPEKHEASLLHYVPQLEEKVLVEPIGNHNRGTTFLNANEIIDDRLNDVFNTLANSIPEFYFGRFDLRCRSIDDLKEGKHFKILELNGAGAEPGHIYQPGYPILKAYSDILWHLAVLADISAINRKRGFAYWKFKDGYVKWREHARYLKMLKRS